MIGSDLPSNSPRSINWNSIMIDSEAIGTKLDFFHDSSASQFSDKTEHKENQT